MLPVVVSKVRQLMLICFLSFYFFVLFVFFFFLVFYNKRGASQMALVKNPTCQCRRRKKQGLDPWVGKIP